MLRPESFVRRLCCGAWVCVAGTYLAHGERLDDLGLTHRGSHFHRVGVPDGDLVVVLVRWGVESLSTYET